MDWNIKRHHASAEELHALGVPTHEVVRTVRLHRPAAKTLVLGSTQSYDDVVPGAAEQLRVQVAKRRSGGGAVLVDPVDDVWIDVVIPPSDPLWHRDVSRAFAWIGEAWVQALQSLGVDAAAYDGPLITNEWSRRVCFAGLGPGEITVGGQKFVGISQRRTREGTLFQCSLYRRFDVDTMVAMLEADPVRAAQLATYLRSYVLDRPDLTIESVQDAFIAALP